MAEKRGRGRPRHDNLKNEDIKELLDDGCTLIEVAEILGRAINTIKYRMITAGFEKNPARRRARKYYSAYDRETEELLATGTAEEVAKRLQIMTKTVYDYKSLTSSGEKPFYLVYEVGE